MISAVPPDFRLKNQHSQGPVPSMFTGIIQQTGHVLWLRRSGSQTQLVVEATGFGKSMSIGDSLAINGCCLTVTAIRRDQLTFDVLEETLRRTNLGSLKPESKVNLERGLRAGDHLDGHLVQGHIDCTAQIDALTEQGSDLYLRIKLPANLDHLVAVKGSIAIDGVSLTVAEVGEQTCAVWIIPHTRTKTRFQEAKTGDMVNVEFDVLARYLDRWMAVHGQFKPTG